MEDKLLTIGRFCQGIRKEKGKTQLDVALDTGYTVSNISEFERGHNNNAILFSWYICLLGDTLLENISSLWR